MKVKVKGHWKRTYYYTGELELEEEELKSSNYYELREKFLEEGKIIETKTYPDDEISFKISY